jgi:phage terminase large subunit
MAPRTKAPEFPRVEIPEAFVPLIEVPLGSVRDRSFWGGRGSGKSWQFARVLLASAAQKPLRILCAREYQASHRDSVMKLLEDQIPRLGLEPYYRVTREGITGINGSEFIFKGLKTNVAEIKSTEGIDVCWVEEAQAVSRESWEVLGPTIRKEGSEIWSTWNPGAPDDPTFVRYVTDPPPASESIIRKVGYKDNPWLPKVLLREAERLKLRDPEAYAHIWGGEPWERSVLQIFAGKYRVAEFAPAEDWGAPLFGLDFGFAVDPSVLVKLFVRDSRLYIGAEAGGVKLDNDDLARRMGAIPGAREHTIRADAARPETINEMKRRGFKVIAAPKWEGSVKDGIEYIRGQFEEIVIHPSCALAIEEARLYRWKSDPRTGDALPVPQKGNDHVWDAVRYALSPLIKRGRAPFVWYPGMKEPSSG